MNAEKLAKLQAQVRIGGKGTPRRKAKKVSGKSSGDDRKLSAALQKLNVQPIPGVDEVNMFKDDGKVIHFSHPRVSAAPSANTFAIHGRSAEKELAELIPNIINQLGPDSMAALKKLAESFQAAQGENAGAAAGADDDEIPDLVESFEKADVEDKAEEKKEESA
ncbi:NAC domain-containing protein [Mycotypha africana]|uniref:NAC domain-containing protein n=1 Tax=Mycotypha africana TaxID=64632 RepID=UPI002301274E|nr:NAC domain-containing protein [Mycotypha africana]KAI8969996.1 NAC domain-containing protein [Mycotypha africana]